MFHEIYKLTERYHTISTELESLIKILGDFATVNYTMATERDGIRTLIDTLEIEKEAIMTALKTLPMVEVQK